PFAITPLPAGAGTSASAPGSVRSGSEAGPSGGWSDGGSVGMTPPDEPASDGPDGRTPRERRLPRRGSDTALPDRSGRNPADGSKEPRTGDRTLSFAPGNGLSMVPSVDAGRRMPPLRRNRLRAGSRRRPRGLRARLSK